jgi:hypothetical protein
MKRSNQKSMKYCKVCRGEWNPRNFNTIQLKFDLLKKERMRDSRQPLGEEQVQYLLQHFFDDDGLHKVLCRKHLREFADISCYKVQHLKELSRRCPDFEIPFLDPPPLRRNWPPHRVVPSQVNIDILDFLESNSEPLPNEQGYFLDSGFVTKVDIFRAFQHSFPNTSVSRNTFLSHWMNLRPDITMNKPSICACKRCTGYKSALKKYNNHPNLPGTILPILAAFRKY